MRSLRIAIFCLIVAASMSFAQVRGGGGFRGGSVHGGAVHGGFSSGRSYAGVNRGYVGGRYYGGYGYRPGFNLGFSFGYPGYYGPAYYGAGYDPYYYDPYYYPYGYYYTPPVVVPRARVGVVVGGPRVVVGGGWRHFGH